MVFKGLIAATAAVALAAAPAIAAGNAGKLAPAAEKVRGSKQEDDESGKWVIAAAAAGVAILGLVIAVGSGDDTPNSPD